MHKLRKTIARFLGKLTRQELNENLLLKSDKRLSKDIERDASLEDNNADDSALSIQTMINVMVCNGPLSQVLSYHDFSNSIVCCDSIITAGKDSS